MDVVRRHLTIVIDPLTVPLTDTSREHGMVVVQAYELCQTELVRRGDPFDRRDP